MTRKELHDSYSVGMGSRKTHMTTLMASFSGLVRGRGEGEFRVVRHFPSEMRNGSVVKAEGEILRRLKIEKHRLGRYVFYRGIKGLVTAGGLRHGIVHEQVLRRSVGIKKCCEVTR